MFGWTGRTFAIAMAIGVLLSSSARAEEEEVDAPSTTEEVGVPSTTEELDAPPTSETEIETQELGTEADTETQAAETQELETETQELETETQESTDAADNYPLRYVKRALTMPRGMLRGTFDLNVFRLDLGPFFGSETFVSLNFGVAIAPVDNLEIGFSRYRTGSFPGINALDLLGFGASGLLSGFVSPEGDFGDIPFYARYQLTSGVVDLALELRVRFPTFSEWGLAWGLPLRIRAGDSVAFDTGVDVTLDDPGTSDILSVGVPFDITGNLSDSLFLKLQSGVSLPDITTDPILTVMPLGFWLGGSVEIDPAMLDLFVAFRFPLFAAFAEGQSEVTTEIWTLTFGVNVYTPVLF